VVADKPILVGASLACIGAASQTVRLFLQGKQHYLFPTQRANPWRAQPGIVEMQVYFSVCVFVAWLIVVERTTTAPIGLAE
jgi:hypothetical protein